MADVVVELVEAKKEEVVEKVLEQVEEKKEEVADKVESVIEKVEEVIAEHPQVAKVVEVVGDQLNGREISCSCFGWLVALRITRKSQTSAPAKSEATPSKESPVPTPSVPVVEEPQTKPPQSSETETGSPSS